MLAKKILFMKVSISVFMIVAFVISSCAQDQKDQKNQEKPATKEQSKSTSIQVKMAVDGMVCSACQSNVKKTIKSFDGVTDVEVSLEKKFAFFTYDTSKVKPEDIQKAINDKGFTAGKVQLKKE